MNRILISVFLALTLSGCLYTAQKYDPYEPNSRQFLRPPYFGFYPAEGPAKKAFENDIDKQGKDVKDVLEILPILSVVEGEYSPLSQDFKLMPFKLDKCDKLLWSFSAGNIDNIFFESYSDVIDDPVCLERFLKFLVAKRGYGDLIPPDLFQKPLPIHCEDKLPCKLLDESELQEKGVPKLTFVHLTDVQLRDEQATLGSPNLSSFVDIFVPTTERDFLQESFDLQYYLALILKINDLIDSEPSFKPEFMIHTGDATDVRTTQELYPFVYISNLLNVPWFNVVGNHDVATFGNFQESQWAFRNAGYSFISPGVLLNFILMHGPTYIHDDLPLTPTNVHEDVTWKMGSFFHGFDLYDGPGSFPVQDNSTPLKLEEVFTKARHSAGYYSLKFKPGIRLIILNTAVPDLNNRNLKRTLEERLKNKGVLEEGEGEYIRLITRSTIPKNMYKGKIDERQFEWLKGKLKEAEENHELVLVFGHHPLDKRNFFKKSLEEIKGIFHEHSNVVAYFCGHTHEQSVKFFNHPDKEKEGKGYGFWQIDAGSILEYPQEGNLITLYHVGDGWGKIEVRSSGVFEEENFEDVKEEIKEMEEEINGFSPDFFNKPLKRMAYLAHYGAARDWEKNHKSWWKETRLPRKNNFTLPFRWPDKVNLQQSNVLQETPSQEHTEDEKQKYAKVVKEIIQQHITNGDSLKVVEVEKIGNGNRIFRRFQIEEIDSDDQNLLEKNPFLYRTLAYLVERAGEKKGEVWQLLIIRTD